MDSPEHVLSCFTPLPPARNGIADYAYMLLTPLRRHFSCIAYTDDIFGMVPPGVALRDERQSIRWIGDKDRILHQIGNNQGHIFVLNALRRHSGVVMLHDLNLLYLYELSSSSLEDILARMNSSSAGLSELYARQWKTRGIKTPANYVLFDMLDEVLQLSRGVIVHSKFALNKIRTVHGDDAASNIAVIPHFAPSIAYKSSAEARRDLKLDAEGVIVLTSGFATKVKRFDWLMAALEGALARGYKFRWIHAGPERPEEYALSQILRSYPRLSAVSQVTGYVSEEDLDTYICASDLVVNLRFPSVGESSGTLARAFSAGKCCIVNDTAAYSELPRDAVVHLPVMGVSAALENAVCGLIDNPDLREALGARARTLARTELSLETVAARYAEVINTAYEQKGPRKSRKKQQNIDVANAARPLRQTLKLERTAKGIPEHQVAQVRELKGDFCICVGWPSPTELSQYTVHNDRFLDDIIPSHFDIRNIRFQWDDTPADEIEPAKGAGARSVPRVRSVSGPQPISLIIDGFAH
ncbi:glycosyltransferase family 4 protein [Pseudochelatococcus sp. B33]